MHLADLRRWAAENGFDPPKLLRTYPAVLKGYQLVWNYHSASRGGGAANLGPSAHSHVVGMVFEIDAATLRLLDAKEGHPTRYSRGTAPMTLERLESGAPVDSWVYRVTEAWTCDGLIRPTPLYRALLVEAARGHGLPEAYIKMLQAIPVCGGEKSG